jgi:hypothetical protein
LILNGDGRLQGEIRYTLSPKGEMLVRLLKTLKDGLCQEFVDWGA